jgi:hypothetical protein
MEHYQLLRFGVKSFAVNRTARALFLLFGHKGGYDASPYRIGGVQ